MAIQLSLVESTPYRLRYLATNSGSPLGGSGTIPNDGGVTPDLLTDLSTAPAGPLQRCVRARLDGFGNIAAGSVLTQGQCRALFLSDFTVPIGNRLVVKAVSTIFARTGTATWAIDANADGQGDPIITITSSAVAGDAYIDIYCRHSFNY